MTDDILPDHLPCCKKALGLTVLVPQLENFPTFFNRLPEIIQFIYLMRHWFFYIYMLTCLEGSNGNWCMPKICRCNDHCIHTRLLKQLLGRKREDVRHLTEEVAIVARELSPTQTAGFNREFVKGLATDAGGRTSHTAIVARSLGIPAVVALEDLTESVKGGDTVIIDGNRGILVSTRDTPVSLSNWNTGWMQYVKSPPLLAMGCA